MLVLIKKKSVNDGIYVNSEKGKVEHTELGEQNQRMKWWGGQSKSVGVKELREDAGKTKSKG